MPRYQEIYNDIFTNEPRYHLAENSPGYQAVVRHSDQLRTLRGRSLDIGCGVGFVVGYLSQRKFGYHAFGVDISDLAIERANERLKSIEHASARLKVIEDQTLPFEDDYFSLVTCFDVFEHLEEAEIDATLVEINRVLRPGGLFFGSASCRKAGMIDKFGDNLHRTVRTPDWWIEKVQPDRTEYEGFEAQLLIWKQNRQSNQPMFAVQAVAHKEPAPGDSTDPSSNSPPVLESSAELYQKIYDENDWYGNAEQNRCPGVRLLPEYEEWIQGRVMDLGCGRGHTVEHLRELGYQADGIDQIQLHPEMQVGDITKPLDMLDQYESVICVDCIEHLHPDQVLGLFENMKRVKRQAFSIHNGPSDETGEELHVNRQEFVDWFRLISKHFDVAAAIKIHDQQMLYLTKTKISS